MMPTDKHLPIVPKIVNIPDNVDFDESIVSVEPSTIELAVSKNDNVTSISTAPIDFSQVSMENNTFTVSLEISSAYRNINSVEKAEVKFDMSQMAEKELSLSSTNFVIKNQGPNQNAAVANKTLTVKVLGPKSRMNILTAASVTAIIDMDDKSTITEGYVERPVTLVFKEPFTGCWLEGTYTVSVRITPKTTTPTVSSQPSA